MNGCTELRQNGMHDMKKVLYMGDSYLGMESWTTAPG